MRRAADRFVLSVLLASLTFAAPAWALPGDVAPGHLAGPPDSPRWIAIGEGRLDLLDVAVIRAAAGGELALGPAARKRADLFPGVAVPLAPTLWFPLGDGVVDAEDAGVAEAAAFGEIVIVGDVSGKTWRWDDGWGPAWNPPTTGDARDRAGSRGRGGRGGHLTR